MTICGIHSDGDGYPNVKYRIQDFKKSSYFSVKEVNVPYKRMISGDIGRTGAIIRSALKFSWAHIRLYFKLLNTTFDELVYLPYPAIFVACGFSLLPGKFRSRTIILDAFISPWDTVVNDRALLSERNLLAVVLKRLELMAYRNATLILVDTYQSKKFMQRVFPSVSHKFVDIPLSTNEIGYSGENINTKKIDGPLKVLFVGTFIPLHGIEKIIEAIKILKDHPEFCFKIVGNGQSRVHVEQFLQEYPDKLIWHSAWVAENELTTLISEADICLGIFGDTEKQQRVCPLKIYAYCAMGKPVITGKSLWTDHAKKNCQYFPFSVVPTDNTAEELAKTLQNLSNNRKNLKTMAKNSTKFYRKYLSNEVAMNKIVSELQRNSTAAVN